MGYNFYNSINDLLLFHVSVLNFNSYIKLAGNIFFK
nr:truncated P40-like protein [Mycoplasmopsis bovis]